ncbi:hypothetical protein CJO09_01950 [Neopusillimonas maritima]|uniref:SxtJ n=1 Tax=Neopusillimonas maritima TaxID=2026239 RepID=A0ABX9MZS3_9BURK|nr:hypothetical protein CJO09_01950 [Neopusillimonas maritima]
MARPTASDRAFGILLCAAAALAASYAFWKESIAIAQSLALLTTILIVMVILCPNKFGRLKLAWLWFGERLGAFVNPLVLTALYFIIVTPTALISRSLGRDALRLKRRRCSTYWIQRPPPERKPKDFFNQQY